MKRQLILCAALASLGATAFAQSSVTLYGKVDIGLRQAIGTDNKELATGSDSRIGFRGTEDLGGGLKAFFLIEHRFFPNDGTIDGPQFWKSSNVGLDGPFGRITLGRQFVAAFSLVQDQVDPFGGDTVAQLRNVGFRVGGISRTRVDSSIRYDKSFGGLNFAASIAEATSNGGPDRPVSVAASYRNGPLFLAAGVEDPANVNDEIVSVGAGYTFGSALVTAGYSSGTMTTGVKAKGWMVGLDWRVGAGSVKAAYGKQERGSTTFAQKAGLGYHHSLSKRTTIYADVGHDSKATRDKTGYDLGIIHRF
jgi:predicted porin